MSWLLVLCGAAAGAPLRYLTDRAMRRHDDTAFPWGTLAVNVTGCLVLGVLSGAAASEEVRLLVGTGLCGALTTYSTLSYETLRLAERGTKAVAAVNVLANVIAGLLAVFLGLALGAALWG